METNELSTAALDAMLKEHALIRAEITERLKTAFSHVAYAGGVVAFAIPVADKISATGIPTPVPFVAAGFGLCGLLWVAILNMRWIQHAGAYLTGVERRVNQHFGCQVLAWEHYADRARAGSWLLIPKAPKVPPAEAEIGKVVGDS